MTIPEYQEKIRTLQADLKSADRLKQRVSRLFPGIQVEIEIEGSRLSIKGLTPEQLGVVMTP